MTWFLINIQYRQNHLVDLHHNCQILLICETAIGQHLSSNLDKIDKL